MKRMITLLLALAMCIGMLPVAAFAQTMPFTDVDEDAFYYDAVAWAVEDGITEGMTRTTFGPDVNCTRGHVVTFLWRLAGCPKPQGDTMPFEDVELNEYYTDAILWAVEQGITEGRDDTHFDPLAECSRAEIAVFLWRFFGSQSVEGLTNPFADVVSGEWYTSAIVWAAARAITDGMPDQTFAFADTCTRGQVVTFLYRAAKLMEDLKEPTEPSEEPTEPSEGDEPGLKLKEDASTVTSGEMLRASTYALTSANDGTSTQATTTKTLKYFDVTLFDYDMATINAATMEKDTSESSKYEGIYFSNGNTVNDNHLELPANSSATADWSDFVDGTYYIQGAQAEESAVNSWVSSSYSYYYYSYSIVGQSEANATAWTLVVENGNYYLKYGNYYLTIGNGTASLSSTKTPVTLSVYPNKTDCVLISQNGYYLNQWGGSGSTSYAGYNQVDYGCAMKFYRYADGKKTLITPHDTGTETGKTSYAEWNYWLYLSGNNANGQKCYTGLVESQLDANKQIVFTKPEGGIFNNDTSVKAIYNNVEMPFVYEDGYYTFDAAQNGVYFFKDETQNSTSKDDEKLRLYFSETPQSNGIDRADGSKTVWMPFNEGTSLNGDIGCNYHFGMIASIPFSMTTNGRVKETDKNSDVIEFTFSGDDDVWVFIDGQLVIDLGGIHNRLDAKIDFAENQVTYSVSNAQISTYPNTGSYNDSTFQTTQTLFGGLISQDRATFAAEDVHTLTVYYLERGQGASNCRISFNLPMKDNVTVTKTANQYWSEKEQKATSLTAEDQAIVDKIDFGFTLYKSEDDGNNYTALANTNYLLLDANKNVIGTPSTDANGHFTLKNGQSAKFITDFASEACYYVVEDNVDANGFYTPDYSYSGTAATGFAYRGTSWTEVTSATKIPEQVLDVGATENKSYEVKIKGSDESSDNLNIICRNYMKSELPNPTILPTDDKLVIDYGLPVNIPDVTSNDVFKGDVKKIVGISGEGIQISGTKNSDGLYTEAPTATGGNTLKYGTAVLNEDGSITYTLNKQMTDVEVIEYVAYAKGSGVDGNESIDLYAAAIGKIYIIPATTMYYEENFSNMVTFTTTDSANPWKEVGTSKDYVQETGIVGTNTDSPYGSDVAYLNNSGDSNGTSKFVDVEKQTAGFRYTFTGTGTSFFARTSEDTGYIYVKIEKQTGDNEWEDVSKYLRDTRYVDKNNPDRILYNIPVYTTEGLEYGTYRLTCYVYQANNGDKDIYGTQFYLDGIRVVNPLDTGSDLAAIATSAYATDGEAYMTSVTLREKLLRNETDYDENEELIWTGDGFVVFTDTNDEIVLASEYESNGPKEELYLNTEQRITFTLVDWDPNTNKLYMGMKAPCGDATVQVGTNNTITLNNSVDCYYEITKMCTIENVDGHYTATFTLESVEGLVSLTNIKVTGTPEFAIITHTFNDDVIGGEGGEDPTLP